MKEPTTGEAFASLSQELADARSAYEEAKKEAKFARSTETARLNYLNEVQKRFDEAVKRLRSDAPAETDWARRPPTRT